MATDRAGDGGQRRGLGGAATLSAARGVAFPGVPGLEGGGEGPG